MTPGEFDIEALQGATFRQSFTWKDGNGANVDRTGYTGRMQIRKSLRDSTVLYEFNTSNGGITLGNGTFSLFAPASVTKNWNFSAGVYDLQMTASDGTTDRVLEGAFTVSPEVTR